MLKDLLKTCLIDFKGNCLSLSLLITIVIILTSICILMNLFKRKDLDLLLDDLNLVKLD